MEKFTLAGPRVSGMFVSQRIFTGAAARGTDLSVVDAPDTTNI